MDVGLAAVFLVELANLTAASLFVDLCLLDRNTSAIRERLQPCYARCLVAGRRWQGAGMRAGRHTNRGSEAAPPPFPERSLPPPPPPVLLVLSTRGALQDLWDCGRDFPRGENKSPFLPMRSKESRLSQIWNALTPQGESGASIGCSVLNQSRIPRLHHLLMRERGCVPCRCELP